MDKSLIICDCLGTQTIDTERLSHTTGFHVPPACSSLCTTQIDLAAAALEQGDCIFSCAQEKRVFDALAQEMDVPEPTLIDLRDRAGWTQDSASTLPKMSTLIAEALLPTPPEKTIDVISEGTCLILGAPEIALEAAQSLKDILSVTVLLDHATNLPDDRDFDVVIGALRNASGALGQFYINIDQLQLVTPGGRGAFTLSNPRDGGRSACDIILDLRGGTPLFPAPDKRDGYLRADPKHAPSVAEAILQASHLIGVFEKPLYIRSEPLLCAHARAEQVGCTRCIDLCPTGAITPTGDHVTIDPMICAGCGACSSACPSGAISYDAPPVELTLRRVQELAKAYFAAGGDAPRLLVHDAHGHDMIAASARHGRGLPANVIPMELPVTGAFGHAEIVAGIAAGFSSVTILAGPKADLDALQAQVDLAQAISGTYPVTLLQENDPDLLEEALYDQDAPASIASPVHPLGSRRQITRQAARAINPDTTEIALPTGAPYGAVVVNTDDCTLCLSCVSLCPSGALGDNPDAPQLRFQEDACLQCGLCATVCPEDAITYEPRLDLSDAALSQTILNEEEPAACIECGDLFGVKSTIDRITEQLSTHAMFADKSKLRMIQMCDDCRVNVQFQAQDNPFQGAEKPRPRTSDDYISKRRDH